MARVNLSYACACVCVHVCVCGEHKAELCGNDGNKCQRMRLCLGHLWPNYCTCNSWRHKDYGDGQGTRHKGCTIKISIKWTASEESVGHRCNSVLRCCSGAHTSGSCGWSWLDPHLRGWTRDKCASSELKFRSHDADNWAGLGCYGQVWYGMVWYGMTGSSWLGLADWRGRPQIAGR